MSMNNYKTSSSNETQSDIPLISIRLTPFSLQISCPWRWLSSFFFCSRPLLMHSKIEKQNDIFEIIASNRYVRRYFTANRANILTISSDLCYLYSMCTSWMHTGNESSFVSVLNQISWLHSTVQSIFNNIDALKIIYYWKFSFPVVDPLLIQPGYLFAFLIAFLLNNVKTIDNDWIKCIPLNNLSKNNKKLGQKQNGMQRGNNKEN